MGFGIGIRAPFWRRPGVLALGVAVALGACDGDRDGDTAADRETIDQLAALGYVDWVEEDDDLSRRGVTHRDPRALERLTLYKSRPRPEAHLIDLDGTVVHTWKAPKLDVSDWWGFIAFFYRYGSKMSWGHIEVQPGGDLLAIVKDRHIEKVGWDSQLIWRRRLKVHHDFDVLPDGRILTLTHDIAELAAPDGPVTIVDNAIATLSAEGKVLKELWLTSLFGGQIPPDRLAAIRAAEARGGGSDEKTTKLRDVFHANTIEMLRRDVPGLGRAGQVLISIRELDLVAVVDVDEPAIVWEWGPGQLQRQHHPSLLPNGNLLIFDNGTMRKVSRVVEVAPTTREIVWQYRSSPPQAFYSSTRGSAQWLPGDHFLITESNSGRAFEIDRDGTILWEFLNPDIDSWKGKRSALYRTERLSPDRVATLPLAPSVAAAESGARRSVGRTRPSP
jgi:hypothetical protein